MKIIQLSDIHFGGHFKQGSFDTMVQEINNDLKPDVIIISGDLTEDGFVFQYEEVKKQIEKLECTNQIILAGNHDYRHTGYKLFEEIFSFF